VWMEKNKINFHGKSCVDKSKVFFCEETVLGDVRS
jgi:hypothetical protein